MVRATLLSSAALATAFSLPAAAQESGVQALEAAAARYAGIQTICADFDQLLQNPLLGDENASTGRLCQQRPNLFRMDFSDPEGDEIVADGNHFWVFYRSLNPDQVLRMPLDPERGGMDFFREFLSEPTERYDVVTEGRESIDGYLTWQLLLEPRSARGLTSARVWVDPEARLIRRIEVVDENGMVRRVDLSDIVLDPQLESGYFEFAIPAGVAVVSNG